MDGSGEIKVQKRASIEKETMKRHKVSIGQDIVHTATRGRIRTAKHFVLPMTVQHLTRSEQLVTMLNRLGHGYSASRIEEYETAIAERFLADFGQNNVFIHSNIKPGSTMVFCWDNND